MIIFNDREMKSNYIKTENRIIQISTPLSLPEVMDKLLQGESINPDQIAVSSFRFAEKEMELQKNDDNYSSNEYDFRYTSQDDIDDAYEVQYSRPFEFDMFEKYTFGRKVQADFKTEGVYLDVNGEAKTEGECESVLTYQELVRELKLASGCLPTLLDADLDFEEMRRYSADGKQLIHPRYPVSKYNPCPSIQDIDHFRSMNTYERRLITSRFIHPMKAFRYAWQMKESISAGYVFNAGDYNRMYKEQPRDMDKFVTQVKESSILTGHPEIKDQAAEVFQELYHFVPRVVNEYIEGCILSSGQAIETITKEDLKEYAGKFNRTSVGKVAQTKSPALLAFSSEINFAEIPRQVTEALSVYISRDNIRDLQSKNFIPWLKEHKNVNPSELTEMIEGQKNLDAFISNLSAKQHIKMEKDHKGYLDSQKFATHYDGYDFSKNELAIRGRHTEAKEGNITMRMLPPDDYANFTVGYDTCCCQHYGSAGQSCVYKLTTDPFAAVVVIEEKGVVKAQGFVWTDEMTDTLVFDNIEFAGNNTLDNQLSQKYLNIIQEWCKAMPYKNIHIGTGYNESMRGWGQPADFMATLPTTISREHTYSDYHEGTRGNGARSVKKDGQMQLKRTDSAAIIEIMTAPDEPTRWDDLAKPEMAFMLNDCSKSIEERIDFARRYNENPTPELQMELIKKQPKAIASMDNADRDVQLYILNNHPDLVSMIKNPIPEVMYSTITKDPAKVLEIEDPPEEMVNLALSADGLLLKHFPDATREQTRIAVNNNGMAIEYASEANMVPEIELVAVANTPKAIRKIPSPTPEVTLAAVRQEPSLVTVLDHPSQETKLHAVRENPVLVLDIKNPVLPGETVEEHNDKVRELWHEAVSRNGYLIRNCGKTFPDLRMVAIQQNPFAIGCFAEPTREEIETAVNQDPKCLLFIRSDEGKEFAKECISTRLGENAVPKKHVYQPVTPITREPEPEQLALA